MANELSYDFGVPLTLVFALANPSANATTAMVVAGGQAFDAITVPTGYVFRPIYLHVESNADLTAGTLTAKVADDGVAIANGPESVLSDTVQKTYAVAGPTAGAGVPAGSDVGVVVVTTAAYLPVTADIDAVLIGLLLPA